MASNTLRGTILIFTIALSNTSFASNLIAPTYYARVVPRLQFPVGDLYQNLYYEGNNLVIRGPQTPQGLCIDSGQEVAQRWREAAQRCRGIFVLRDSLYSQQDHPYRQVPFAPILPPNWITAAVNLTHQGKLIQPLSVFDVYDDDRWSSLVKASDLFGSFPVSDALFKRATSYNIGSSPSKQREIYNARMTLIALAKETRYLIEAAPKGVVAVAQIGAERISFSDRKYFGTEVRRDHIIPIFVENPTIHEIFEGKGTVPQNQVVSNEVASMTTQVIYKRRLQDGDLAIERYDLSQLRERTRAIAVLESIIPKDDTQKTVVWLWVTGPLNDRGELTGQDATPWVEMFREELGASCANGRRVVLFSKPSIDLPPSQFRQSSFDTYVQQFEQLGMPMSVNLTTKSLTSLIEPIVTSITVD